MDNIKHKSLLQMLLSIPIAGVLVGIDQLTKYWANTSLRVNGPVTVINGVFSFTWTQNDGAAWGMLGGNVILNWLPIIIAVIVAVLYQRIPVSKRMLPLNIIAIMLFAGAIGNRIDRSVYGYVQDFLYFELIDFPIFNVADCYIVVACIAAIILLVLVYKDEDEMSRVFSFKNNKTKKTVDYPDEALVKSMTFAFTDTINWLEEVVGHTFAKPRPFGYGGPNYAHAPSESPVPASGRGSSPAGGRFVIKNVKLYLDKMGVPVRTATPVTDLIQNDKGEVVGVKASDKKTVYEVSAKAVVLATGGFAHNKEMMERLVPVYAPYTDKSVATVGATGDGIRMAVKAGGVEYEDAWVIGLYVSGAKPEYSKTFTSKDKYKDRVFVNEKGERFVNEDLPYLTDPVAMQKAVWAIVDSQDPKKVEVLNGVQDPKISVKANSWKELGDALGVPAEALEKTMTDYNRACETGDDKAFGKPKAFLKPFTKAPFYAVRVIPQTGGTMGGVKVDDHFRVVDKEGKPVKGLYAGGEVINRPYYNRVYTSGTGLGIAYTSGRLAGEYAAKEALGK